MLLQHTCLILETDIAESARQLPEEPTMPLLQMLLQQGNGTKGLLFITVGHKAPRLNELLEQSERLVTLKQEAWELLAIHQFFLVDR